MHQWWANQIVIWVEIVILRFLKSFMIWFDLISPFEKKWWFDLIWFRMADDLSWKWNHLKIILKYQKSVDWLLTHLNFFYFLFSTIVIFQILCFLNFLFNFCILLQDFCYMWTFTIFELLDVYDFLMKVCFNPYDWIITYCWIKCTLSSIFKLYIVLWLSQNVHWNTFR